MISSMKEVRSYADAAHFPLPCIKKQTHSAGKERPMNVKKDIDYRELYRGIDAALAASLPQMALYNRQADCRAS